MYFIWVYTIQHAEEKLKNGILCQNMQLGAPPGLRRRQAEPHHSRELRVTNTDQGQGLPEESTGCLAGVGSRPAESSQQVLQRQGSQGVAPPPEDIQEEDSCLRWSVVSRSV